MAERYLRISALFERTDLVKIDGHWCCPISGLSESLSRHGFRVVPTQPVPEGHGTQGEPAAAQRSAHETALGDSKRELCFKCCYVHTDAEGCAPAPKPDPWFTP